MIAAPAECHRERMGSSSGDCTMEIMADGVRPLSRPLQQLLSPKTAGFAAVSSVAGLLSVPSSPAR